MAFESVFRSIDFGAVPRAEQARQTRLMEAIGAGAAMYEREREREQQERILNMEMEAKKAKAAADVDALASSGYMAMAKGGVPTPEQTAAMDVKAALMRPKSYVDPYTGLPVVESPVDPRTRLGVAMPGTAPAQAVPSQTLLPSPTPLGAPPRTEMPVGIQEQVVAEEEFIPTGAQLMTPEQFAEAKEVAVTGPLAGTPKGILMETEARLDVEKQKALKGYETEISRAGAELKEKKGQRKVADVLGRMKQINEELKNKKAIVSGDASLKENIGRYISTTGLGQEARKIKDPETQALAEEYTKLQSTLLPYYASAAGLGAKSLDSEGERKSILGSFGDPSGIYEANKRQLQTLEGLFGVEDNGEPVVSPARPTREQIMRELQKRRSIR
jgi:hypothetical protein